MLALALALALALELPVVSWTSASLQHWWTYWGT
jgi:hypothetical protein